MKLPSEHSVDRSRSQVLMNEYVRAAEALYTSMGIAMHSDGGEIVAFTTTATVECLHKFHAASMAIAVFMGDAMAKEKE